MSIQYTEYHGSEGGHYTITTTLIGVGQMAGTEN